MADERGLPVVVVQEDDAPRDEARAAFVWPRAFRIDVQRAQNLRAERWRLQLRAEQFRARDYARRGSNNHIMRSLRLFAQRHPWLVVLYRPWGRW